MLAIPEELLTALSEHGWMHDGVANLWTNGDSWLLADGDQYRVGVRARGIQPAITRDVGFEAAIAWARRDLEAFARLANRRR